jgi:succinate dehydrogenase / fumarate reductase flavoprotein subunit
MFDYVPDVFRQQYAETEDEADRWYTDPDNNRRPPELLPRDEVARAINSEVKEGRGTPAGGVYLDVSTRMRPEVITRRLPSMYHQFKELADVDITAQPMEVGPTCHYVMGGIEVDPDTAAAAVAGLFAAGEVSGGMHGSNRLGGNSLSDLLVFGKRAGEYAAAYAGTYPTAKVGPKLLESAVSAALAPLERGEAGENPYTLHSELQQVMNDLVGIIRRKAELEESLSRLADLKERYGKVGAGGGRRFNPGWHLALDMRNMLIVSECTAKAALTREESRGGHTREDFPQMEPAWRRVNLVCSLDGEEVRLERKPLPAMRTDLFQLFDRGELAKYLTEDELTEFDTAGSAASGPEASDKEGA